MYSTIDWVVLALFSIVSIVAAVRVVTSRDVMRSALALVVSLAALAPLFLLLGAEFAAVIQVLVYVGAVVVLFLFGVMLTRDVDRGSSAKAKLSPFALISAAALFGLLGATIAKSSVWENMASGFIPSLEDIGIELLGTQLLAFELMSLLLLGALIGALTLARRR